MALPWIALGALGFFLYKAFNQSMKNIYAERPTKPGDIGEIAAYQDIGNAFVDPQNYTSNLPHMPIVREEIGEFGVPRVIYKGGEKGSNIVTYGVNYRKF
jgi:hypothetical protein